MNDFEKVILDYSHGKVGLDETNEKLKEMGSKVTLDPMRNVFTAEELMNTTVGETPDEANGYGLMDHGVGCMEKVHVVSGRTPDVNMGEEVAFVFIGGKKYRLRGDVLVDEE